MGEIEEIGPVKPHSASEAAAAEYATHLAKLHSTPAVSHDDSSGGGGGSANDKVSVMGQRDRTSERVQAMRRAYESSRAETQRAPKGVASPEPETATPQAEAEQPEQSQRAAAQTRAPQLQTPPTATTTPQNLLRAAVTDEQQQTLDIEVNADEAATQAADNGDAPGQNVAEGNAAATIHYGKSSGRKGDAPGTSASASSRSSAGRSNIHSTHAGLDLSGIEDVQTLASVLGASSPETSAVMAALNDVPFYFTPSARF